LTNAVRGATDAFARAAQECITGVDGKDSAALDRFRSDLDNGQKQVGVAGYITQKAGKPG